MTPSTATATAIGTKGQRTRAAIVQTTAALMNRGGFLSVPMADIVAACGIQKGGLYRHFESREALAYAAFDHAVASIRARLLAALEGQHTAGQQLLAIVQAYQPGEADVPFAGGCPIMNSAIESDHAHAGLRERAQQAMGHWRGLLRHILQTGQQAGEVRADVVPDACASVIIATLEGAVMLTHLYGTPSHLAAAVAHLAGYIERDICQPTPA